MKPWRRIEPTTVQKIGWRTVVTKTFEMPSGKVDTFDTIHPEGQQFAGVIALTPENKVIIARQFRYGPEMVMDDLPGGYVDPGETPDDAVKRELLEETGYSVGSLTYLGPMHKDVYFNAVWHCFLATNCTLTGEQELDPSEHIEVDLISIDQLIDNAKNDRMTDGVAVLMAYEKLLKIKETA